MTDATVMPEYEEGTRAWIMLDDGRTFKAQMTAGGGWRADRSGLVWSVGVTAVRPLLADLDPENAEQIGNLWNAFANQSSVGPRGMADAVSSLLPQPVTDEPTERGASVKAGGEVWWCQPRSRRGHDKLPWTNGVSRRSWADLCALGTPVVLWAGKDVS